MIRRIRVPLPRVAAVERVPLRPQSVVRAISDSPASDALVCLDCGANTHFAARFLMIRDGQQLVATGMLATMAPGLPFAIAAQLAYPGRQVVAIVGDGGFAMLMAELSTAVRYSLPVKDHRVAQLHARRSRFRAKGARQSPLRMRTRRHRFRAGCSGVRGAGIAMRPASGTAAGDRVPAACPRDGCARSASRCGRADYRAGQACCLSVRRSIRWPASHAASSLLDLRVAEISKRDMRVEGGKVVEFRARISLSLKYEV